MPSIKSKRLNPNPVSDYKPNYRSFKVKEYATERWRKYSLQLRMERMRCELSGRIFTDPAKLVVDHIIPVNEGGSFWDARNHQVISIWQHAKKTNAEKSGSKAAYILNDMNEKIPKL